MKFNDLDTKMRVYETSFDLAVPPGMWMVARLDGRGFTKWTKSMEFEKPFDINFHRMMLRVVMELMERSGFHVLYGYTESDEISLLLHKDEETFGRKLRKMNSTLAGLASAIASMYVQRMFLDIGANLDDAFVKACTFDCRISVLPSSQEVEDYFRWRMEDSHRNCLNGYCYWLLRKSGLSKREATRKLEGKGVSFKNELLFTEFDLNYNTVPAWQRRGAGLYWETYIKEAVNPQTGEEVQAVRKRLKINSELPMGDEYGKFIRKFLEEEKIS